jgi:hypothetical protein
MRVEGANKRKMKKGNEAGRGKPEMEESPFVIHSSSLILFTDVALRS